MDKTGNMTSSITSATKEIRETDVPDTAKIASYMEIGLILLSGVFDRMDALLGVICAMNGIDIVSDDLEKEVEDFGKRDESRSEE